MTTPYSQRDPRWAGKHLGKSPCTMGNEGCATAAIAFQTSRELNRDVTPGELCDFLSRDNGYTMPSPTDPKGGLLKWDRISAFTHGQLHYLGRGSTPPARKKYTLVGVHWGKLLLHWL